MNELCLKINNKQRVGNAIGLEMKPIRNWNEQFFCKLWEGCHRIM